MNKSWAIFSSVNPREIPGTVGVYELADADGTVIYIGFAGGRSLLGLRGCITDHFSDLETNPIIQTRARQFRYEITTSYLTRAQELLSWFHASTGELPDGNALSQEPIPPLARFRAAEPSAPPTDL